MAGDYSRKTFIPTRHYSRVLMQQGRVQLDADWNEQADIQHHRVETETVDVIGQTGVPKNHAGFGITPTAPDGQDLTLSAGRLYLDGLLCELDQPTTYRTQPHLPNPPALTTFADGTYVAYLDAWQREVTFRDDPHIHEVALGEADTTARLQTVWQVSLLKVTTGQTTPACETDFAEWTALTAPVTGTLNVRTEVTTDPKNPCALPPTTGFRRLENQFYRVEVQTGGTLGAAAGASPQPTFKWSRDNASVETSIETVAGAVLTVSDLGRDADTLGFKTDQWVEVVDEVSTLTVFPQIPDNKLFQIKNIDADLHRITLDRAVNAPAPNTRQKLRRWDQAGAEVSMNLAPAWLDLEDGIQLQFAAGTYHPGDYWTFAARTATGDVAWPQSAPNTPAPQPPAGVGHHYCRLALLTIGGGKATKTGDCRKLFPPLTELPVSTGTGSCTLTAVPELGWEKIFDRIGPGQDAQICFPVGEFPLTVEPKRITGKGHLKIDGSGPGTRITALGLEAALIFDDCKSVLIRDISVESRHNTDTDPDGQRDLNGALTCLNCPVVDVEQVQLTCGSGFERTATCLTVRNDKQPGSVRVQHCRLQIGNQQEGILLVNAGTALVSDNSLQGITSSLQPENFAALLTHKPSRDSIRQLLFNRKPAADGSLREKNNVTVKFENQAVTFATRVSLRDAWQKLAREHPLKDGATPDQAMNHLETLADRLLTDAAFRRKAPAFEKTVQAMARQTVGLAARGITIGGRAAFDVRVLNNTIVGALQGVHVGQSHRVSRDQLNNPADQALAVTIAGNTIAIVLPAWAMKQERHGIFTGNCRSLLIENNNILLNRLPETETILIDGIRVWGLLGDRLMITKNYAASTDDDQKGSFSNGISVHPTNKPDPQADSPKPPNAQWVVMWNVAPSRNLTVDADPALVRLLENTP